MALHLSSCPERVKAEEEYNEGRGNCETGSRVLDWFPFKGMCQYYVRNDVLDEGGEKRQTSQYPFGARMFRENITSPFSGGSSGFSGYMVKGATMSASFTGTDLLPVKLAVTCLLFRGLRPSVWRQW